MTKRITIEVPDDYDENATVAELFVRGVKGWCIAILKCRIVKDDNNAAEDTLNKFENAVDGWLSRAEQARKLARDINNSLKDINDNIVKISNNLESIFKNLKSVSYLQVGLSAANLAATVAGIVIIENHLNSIETKVDVLQKEVEKLNNISFNKELENFGKIKWKFNRICDAIKNNEIVDNNKLDALLMEMKLFIDQLTKNMVEDNYDLEQCLEILHGILPAFVSILDRYITVEFISKGFKRVEENANIAGCMDTVRNLLNDSVNQAIFDHYFLTGKANGIEATDIVSAHKLIIVNHYSVVADKLKLLKEMDTAEEYHKFEAAVEKEAQRVMDDFNEQYMTVSAPA